MKPHEFFTRVLPEEFAKQSGGKGRTSKTVVVLELGDDVYSFSLANGHLLAKAEKNPGAVVGMAISLSDFEGLFSSSLHSASASPLVYALGSFFENDGLADRLAATEARFRLLVRDGNHERALYFGLGSAAQRVFGEDEVLSAEQAGLSIAVALEDLRALERGEQNPMEMFMQGKIQISGDPTPLLLLAGSFMGGSLPDA